MTPGILRKILIVLLCAGFLLTCEMGRGQSKAASEALAALAERDAAFRAGDVDKVAGFMADEYLQTDIWGHVQDKEAWLKQYYRPMAGRLKSGELKWTVMERTEIVSRELGDTVILAGKQTIQGVDGRLGEPSRSDAPPMSLRFTHVWVKRGGKWQVAMIHNAIPAAEPAKAESR
jgi:ketosteroid isomerase-like protein